MALHKSLLLQLVIAIVALPLSMAFSQDAGEITSGFDDLVATEITPVNPVSCEDVRRIVVHNDRGDSFCDSLCFYSQNSNPMEMLGNRKLTEGYRCAASGLGVSCEREVGGIANLELVGDDSSAIDQKVVVRPDDEMIGHFAGWTESISACPSVTGGGLSLSGSYLESSFCIEKLCGRLTLVIDVSNSQSVFSIEFSE
jgi:hypothetical protein